jgi:LemA protein
MRASDEKAVKHQAEFSGSSSIWKAWLVTSKVANGGFAMLTTLLFVVLGIVVFAVLVAAYMFVSYKNAGNYVAALDARCDTAFADIDVHLKHRHDLLPRLVEVVKSQTAYEKDMVMGVANARVEAMRAMSPEVKLECEKNLSAQIFNLLSNVEKNPDLKALPEFRALRDEITACDNRITASRRFYNLAIEEYNVALSAWPTSSIAMRRRLSKRLPFDLGLDRMVMDEPQPLGL